MKRFLKQDLKRYLEHPIVKAPVIWLKGGQTYQAPELYKKNGYQEGLESNPFAQSLVRTHKDSASFRFPNGSLIRLNVTNDPNKENSYLLGPDNEDLDFKKISAASYVLGNKNYIEIIESKGWWMRYLSLKYRNKSDNKVVRMTRIVSDFGDKYRQDLESRINQALTKVELGQPDSFKEGINLMESGKLYEVNGRTVNICIPNIDLRGFMLFKNNEKLCYDILRLMRYYI